jgi:hypothetical protein
VKSEKEKADIAAKAQQIAEKGVPNQEKRDESSRTAGTGRSS